MDGLWFRFNCVSVFSTYSVYSVTLYDSRIAVLGIWTRIPYPFRLIPKYMTMDIICELFTRMD